MTAPERPAIRMPSGEVIAMPDLPQFEEFALPGNFWIYPEAGMVTFYDPTSQTGAIYYRRHGTWALEQPVTREVFVLRCQLLARTDVGQKLAEEITAALVVGAGMKH